MSRTILPSSFPESVSIPPSKSYAQRAILAASQCQEQVLLRNVGNSEDVLHLLEAIQELGASVTSTKEGILIQRRNTPKNVHLHIGESGLGVRLITALAAVTSQESVITGSGSLLKRSLAAFDEILPQLGLTISSNNGFLPLEIKGKATANTLNIDGSKSSQYLSGLLMSLPLLSTPSTIHVAELKSQPYIAITLDVLSDFGIEITHENYENYQINAPQEFWLKKKEYTVEGDFSGASNWMVVGALSQSIRIKGLNPKTVQGDAAMLDALTLAQVGYQWEGNELLVKKSTVLPFEFDATECPDLFPALVVLAAGAIGTTTLKGVSRLEHKESSRGIVLQAEFEKLGLQIDLDGDIMKIHGTGELTSGTISSNNDHRIAMAGAIAACLTSEGVTIQEPEAVGKSYPNFWEDFK